MVVDKSQEETNKSFIKMFNMSQCQWWKEPNLIEEEEEAAPLGSCSAARMWRSACNTLVAPHYERAWTRIVDTTPSDNLWHSLRNCTAYQAGVWASLLRKGVCDVTHPAGFRLAIVLRHTPSDLAVKLLADLLCTHPQSQDLIDYILALLTDDEPTECGVCGGGPGVGDGPRAPHRDRLLFGDCELAVLAANREEYDAHAKMVRAEYATLTQENYVELRIKILNQLNSVPVIYQTPEFQPFEPAARENIEREITFLREHLLTGRKE